MNKNIELLKRIVEFLNNIPKKKYRDNYALASELDNMIKSIEEQNTWISNALKELEDEEKVN